MGLLVDKSLYSLFGEQESRITEFLLDLTNMVDMVSQPLVAVRRVIQHLDALLGL